MKYVSLVFSAAFLATAACASSGPYRPAAGSSGTGYSHQAIEADRYRVQFRSAGRDAAKAQDYALLRAAELTLERGYSTFEVVSRSAGSLRERDPASEFATGPDYAVTRSCGLLGCTATTRPVMPLQAPETQTTRQETVVVLEITLSNKDATVSPSLYSASQVAASLGAR